MEMVLQGREMGAELFEDEDEDILINPQAALASRYDTIGRE